MARRDRRTSAVGIDPDGDADVHGGGLALDTESPIPPTGPHDSEDLDPEVTDAAGLVDFGSIRVPLPPQGTVTVEPTSGGRMQAVHIRLPEGRLSLSALAAPKTSKLWPELAREIDASLREGGARVRSFPGGWGRELHATSGGATSVFVGVDGPRWMLYGVATGPSEHSPSLDAELRRMLRGTVVVRGKQPYPVRTILPLTMPEHLAAEAADPPAVPAAAAKKRSPAKAAPGKSAPGKTAPPNSDAATAAAKKAAARRAAARRAAAAAAVKAAAEALAEQAAEDGDEAEEDLDTRPAARNGVHPARGTIPTGPGPDAPLREQAPSARRAAAAAWRTRPAAPEDEAPPPTEALPLARPVEEPPVTEAFPAARAEALPPTEALRVVDPGTGGRRRLGEPAPPAPPVPGGRRHLPEPPAEQSYPGARRRLREPAADLPPPAPRPGATAPWETVEPGGRRRLREPLAEPGVSEIGRRRLREPFDGAPRGAQPWDTGHEPPPSVPDTGVSASGRRRLPEPVDGVDRGPRQWDAGPRGLDGAPRRPAEPFGARPRDEPPPSVPDTGVSASGRRRLRAPFDGADPVGPAADTGVSASGRRRLREPWETGAGEAGGRPWPGEGPDPDGFPSGRRRLRDPWDPAPAPTGSVADTGGSASGRRRLREPWDEAAGGLDGGGRRRLGEPSAPDQGVSGTGRRRLREPWEEAPDPAPVNGVHQPAPGGRRGQGAFDDPIADTGVSASGRRRLREPLEPAGPVADTGVSASGRRRLREPWDDAPPAPGDGPGGRRRPSVPEPVEPAGRRRRELDAADDPSGGTGGRRRRREVEPAPVRDGSQTEPWMFAPEGPPERSARRTLGAEYLIETGEQDSGFAAAVDDYAGRRDGGRHSGAGDVSDPTVRLQALLGELDPNRPRRRHRR